MESGLAGIQEVATPGYHLGGGSPESERRLGYGTGSLDHGVGQLANPSATNTNHLDPRSGLVSSAAVRMDTNDNSEQTGMAERAPDGRPLFRTTRLGDPAEGENFPRSMGVDAETLAGVLAGSRVIADLEARSKSRGRGMTNDTAGTGVDPLHIGNERQNANTVGKSASNGMEESVQGRSVSRVVDTTGAVRTGATGAGLQPTVTSLSQADTEEAVTPMPREHNV